MRVIIADDHVIVREGMKSILNGAPDISFIGEASNAQELIDLVRLQSWDVVILDINMPGKSGLDVLKEIKQEYPKLPVLVLSVYPEDQYAVRVIKAGASGYLNKTAAADELVKAIRKVKSGGKYISEIVGQKLAEAVERKTDVQPHELLSDREFQVFLLLAKGNTVSETAENLSLSVKTISTYRTHILDKMNLKNNAEIMHYAIQNNLVE